LNVVNCAMLSVSSKYLYKPCSILCTTVEWSHYLDNDIRKKTVSYLGKYGIYAFIPLLRQFIVISIISVTNTFVDLGLCSHHAWITTWSCPWLFSSSAQYKT